MKKIKNVKMLINLCLACLVSLGFLEFIRHRWSSFLTSKNDLFCWSPKNNDNNKWKHDVTIDDDVHLNDKHWCWKWFSLKFSKIKMSIIMILWDIFIIFFKFHIEKKWCFFSFFSVFLLLLHHFYYEIWLNLWLFWWPENQKQYPCFHKVSLFQWKNKNHNHHHQKKSWIKMHQFLTFWKNF